MGEHRTFAEDIWESIEASPLKYQGISGLPSASDRGFWEGLDSEVRRVLLSLGEESLKAAFPVILLSDYRKFSQNGNRVDFEGKYFGRRKMLASLVLAECVEDKGRFIDKILDGLTLLLEETSWCLPAHNAYIRDTKQLPVPNKERPIIDLFAAETGAFVGIAEQLLRDRFQKVSPLIGAYVDRELRERILTPYLSCHFWWMGNGREALCNWTPWITQNVLLTLFTRPAGAIDTVLLKRVLEQAALSIDYFLDDYGDDGCCNEGAQYYSHAGLCLFGCIDVLDRITGGSFAKMYEMPLVKNIAAYILRMYVGEGYYINYADCSPFPGRRGVRDFLFALGTKNQDYAAFAASDFRKADVRERLLPEDWNLYYKLLTLLQYREIMNFPARAFRAEDFFFASVGLLVSRDRTYTLAVKAGDNADSHNHNDVGSVTLYKNAQPFLIDLGVETYTAKTFSKERYEIWTMQSGYHNTVNFLEGGGQQALSDQNVPQEDSIHNTAIDHIPLIGQRDGKAFAASAVKANLGEEEASLALEMAGAYGDERIKSVKRRVTLRKNEGILIEDAIVAELPAVLTFMTYEKPAAGAVTGGKGAIQVGALGTIEFEGIKNVVIETCPITDERLQIAWEHDCYRILLYAEGDSTKVFIQ